MKLLIQLVKYIIVVHKTHLTQYLISGRFSRACTHIQVIKIKTNSIVTVESITRLSNLHFEHCVRVAATNDYTFK